MTSLVRRLLRVLPAILVLTLFLVATVPPIALRTILERRGWLAAAIALAARWPVSAVEVGSVTLHPDGTFEVEDVHFAPPDPHSPEVRIWRLTGSMPDPYAVWFDRRIDLGRVEIVGLEVDARTQEPPHPLAHIHPNAYTVAASSITLVAGTYRAPRTGPLPAVDVGPVGAVATDFAWTPRNLWWHCTLSGAIDQFAIGEVAAEDLQIAVAFLDGWNLELGSTTFRYLGTVGMMYGDIRGLQGRADTRLHVVVADERLEQLVRSTLGRESPVRGGLSARLLLLAGGLLPPGGAQFSGWIAVHDAEVRAPERMSAAESALVSLAPWIARNGDGWLGIGDLVGRATFGRGWVRVQTLERVHERQRTLQAWGSLDTRRADLRVRIVPRRNERHGFGVSVRGALDDPQVRLARADELLRAPPLVSH